MNFEQLAKSLKPERLEKAIEGAVKETRDQLVLRAFDDIVEGSPVLTGSYRARHQIDRGGSGGEVIYVHPQLPPVEGIKTLSEVIPAPDLGQVEDSMSSVEPYALVTIHNDINYSEEIEYGSATNEPRMVYENARITAQLDSDDLLRSNLKQVIKNGL